MGGEYFFGGVGSAFDEGCVVFVSTGVDFDVDDGLCGGSGCSECQ